MSESLRAYIIKIFHLKIIEGLDLKKSVSDDLTLTFLFLSIHLYFGLQCIIQFFFLQETYSNFFTRTRVKWPVIER